MQRRRFLKVLAGGIGGALLTSCGSGNNGGGEGGDPKKTAIPAPNGYEFYRILDTGDALPEGSGKVVDISPALMINDNSEIIVHCKGDNEARGVYQYTIDYLGARPAVAESRSIIRQGDILSDGYEVMSFGIGCTNKNGYYALSVTDAENNIPGIYLDRDTLGLMPVVNPSDDLPGNAGKFAACFGDLELDDTNAIILASHYVPEGENVPKQGLFFLCGSQVTDAGRLLLSSGDLIPGAGTNVGRIGLVDIDRESGEFSAQIACGVPKSLRSLSGASGQIEQTALISGNVNQPTGSRLLAGSRSLNLSRATSMSSVRGDVLFGPRVGGKKSTAQVVHDSDESMTLYLDGVKVLASGELSPLEEPVINFSGPMVGRDGLLYFCVMSESGTELCLYDGVDIHSIITFGEMVEVRDDRIVAIDFGGVRNMVDSEGRLVFHATFESGVKSVILGVPV